MRLGGTVFYDGTNPEEYALAHVEKGFGAALCPDWISLENPAQLDEFKRAMRKHDVCIAEVGAWCNPLHPDKKEAEKNIQYMIQRLQLAEELEAVTCVNILGTKSVENWYAPTRESYSNAFFEEAVAVSQRIIDAVKPVHTKLSFEMMPYNFLDDAKEYLHFLGAVDRDGAGVHLDICNTINHPRLLYRNEEHIRETFSLLRDKIVTLHLKDITLRKDTFTVEFNEVLIGTGDVNYEVLMKEIAALSVDTPAMLEHLQTEEEYDAATAATLAYAEMAGMEKKGMVWQL
nr:sugar phosphate isomerase/epimerase [Eubacterium sp.]